MILIIKIILEKGLVTMFARITVTHKLQQKRPGTILSLPQFVKITYYAFKIWVPMPVNCV